MYKLNTAYDGTVCIRKDCGNGVILLIPFDPDNTDYANFKRDIADGAELQDADGNVMTADAAKAFVGTLP